MPEQEEDGEDTLWWGQPLRANRYHIFEGKKQLAGSLCGSWHLGWDGHDPEVDPEEDDFTEGQDCKKCAKRAGVLEEQDG